MAKQTTPSNLSATLRAIDTKNRGFWDSMTDEERKKHSNYLALRWSSSISEDGDLGNYYVLSTNQNANKHFWSLNRHPKLQWLLITCVSPGMGVYRHEWIAFSGKTGKNKRAQFFMNMYPAMKITDAEVLASVTTDDELKIILQDLGHTDQEIKKTMKDLA